MLGLCSSLPRWDSEITELNIFLDEYCPLSTAIQKQHTKMDKTESCEMLEFYSQAHHLHKGTSIFMKQVMQVVKVFLYF